MSIFYQRRGWIRPFIVQTIEIVRKWARNLDLIKFIFLVSTDCSTGIVSKEFLLCFGN